MSGSEGNMDLDNDIRTDFSKHWLSYVLCFIGLATFSEYSSVMVARARSQSVLNALRLIGKKDHTPSQSLPQYSDWLWLVCPLLCSDWNWGNVCSSELEVDAATGSTSGVGGGNFYLDCINLMRKGYFFSK